jgi:hypothetical protein
VTPSSRAFVSVAVPYSSVPQMYRVSWPARRQYRANASPERSWMMFPRWGMLLTYGRAAVIRRRSMRKGSCRTRAGLKHILTARCPYHHRQEGL